MSEREASPFHRKYIGLTTRYKSAWTFHRFLEGLRKFFGSREVGDYPADFQSLYKRLKDASTSLDEPGASPIAAALNGVEDELNRLIEDLEERDRKVAPSLLRLFFQRVKTHDERILIDMVRFYQEAQRQRSWEPDRIDKVDFLVTRLAEVIAGPDLKRDRTRLGKVLQGLSANSDVEAVDPQKVANRAKLVEAARSKIRGVKSFEELTESDLVGHYRSLKHGLGSLYFEGSLLPLLVDTNGILRSRVQDLTKREEERILVDYERISRLEREGSVDRGVMESVGTLHLQVQRFQNRVRAGNVRIADLVELRRILDRIETGLGVAAGEGEAPPGPGPAWDTDAFTLPLRGDADELGELVMPQVRELVDALSGVDPDSDPEETAFSERLRPFRLEAREVLAYRRLTAGVDCDERLERFLILAAALRRRINEDVEEIHGLRSDLSGGESEHVGDAERTVGLAGWYLGQFSHYLEGRLLDGEVDEARQLQLLRMRLMRDYSGLWLLTRSSL